MRDRRAGKPEKRRVLILVNHDVVIYNFRLELVERLLEDSYEVHISSPYGERIEDLERIGAHYHRIEFDRHGMSPLEDGRILLTYLRLIATLSPRIVLGYTIKPNLYGAVAARFFGVPFVANITGLGTALEKDGFRKYLVIAMYKLAFLRIRRVFFQNLENERFFRKYRIAVHAHALLPGSGVNLSRFPEAPYPVCGDGKTGEPVRFAFISRIMKEKGIEQFLRMARAIHRHYPQTEFHVYGFCEAEYEGALAEWGEKQVVRYHGMVRDVAAVMSEAHCIVHPTYYPEGISNVLLEAQSIGRPVITTDRTGCREAVRDGVSGILVPERDARALILAVKRFLALDFEAKAAMGLAGRRFVEKHFDRHIVVERYMQEVEK